MLLEDGKWTFTVVLTTPAYNPALTDSRPSFVKGNGIGITEWEKRREYVQCQQARVLNRR
jgi:hypothetical protein